MSNRLAVIYQALADKPRLLCVVAIGLSFVSLYPSVLNGWINWDDGAYVLSNSMVHTLSGEHLYQIFSTSEQLGLYLPLSILSLAVDYSLFGADATGYHWMNLGWHLLNVLLVFQLFRRFTQKPVVAFIVALLFGMHPMHVESVAWISGRKDVLYTFFLLIAWLSYWRYLQAKKPRSVVAYGLAVLTFALALLSKSLAFTLPFLLLLTDYWYRRSWSWKVVWDKIPFFLLALGALVLTKQAQQSSDTMLELTAYPFHKTPFLATANTLNYLFKAVAPLELSPFHPFPFDPALKLSWWYYLSAIPVLLGFYFWVRSFKKQREIAFGIGIFLVSLAPILQFIPFGKTIISERYTYVAYLGVFFLLGVALHRLLERTDLPRWRAPLLIATLCWMVGLGIKTFQQAQVWKDSNVLWSSVIEAYPNDYYGYLKRGTYFIDKEYFVEPGLADLCKSVELNPNDCHAYYERGRAYEKQARFKLALEEYERAMQLDSTYAPPYLNRGVLAANNQKVDLAILDFKTALRHKPNYSLAHFNLGIMYKLKGNYAEALTAYSTAIDLEPNNATYLNHRAVFHYEQKDLTAALEDFTRSIVVDPYQGKTYLHRAQIYLEMGDKKSGLKDLDQAEALGVRVASEYREQFQ